MDTPWYIFTEISSFVTEATGNLLLFITTLLYFQYTEKRLRDRQKLTCIIKWQIKARHYESTYILKTSVTWPPLKQ